MKVLRKALKQNGDDPELDISSLIDISFLLLIFFLVSSTLMKKETDLGMNTVGLPGCAIDPPDRLAIEIAADGRITVGGEEMSGPSQDGEPGQIVEIREQLVEHRKRADLIGDKMLVSLDASGEANTQRFIDVVNALAYAGIDHVALADY